MSFCPTNFYFKKCDLASFFINLLSIDWCYLVDRH
mgnify:CR=1 FL=1